MKTNMKTSALINMIAVASAVICSCQKDNFTSPDNIRQTHTVTLNAFDPETKTSITAVPGGYASLWNEGDYITFTDTDVNELDEVYMFHPTYTYINKTVKDFEAVPLLVDIFDKGELVYNLPTLAEIQDYARKEYDKLWDEYKRLLNPQDYPVDLSQEVWQNKMDLIDRIRKEAQQKGEVK